MILSIVVGVIAYYMISIILGLLLAMHHIRANKTTATCEGKQLDVTYE